MKPAQIVLLLVALLAGGLAAFLATRGSGPAPATGETVTEVIQEPKVQILVAREAIGVAERLSPANVEWQDWPTGAIREDYVTIAAMPNAAADLTGAVARFEFFPGEPIREKKLVRADQGYLSAVLEKGKRGVSIAIAPASGSGGFIVPNDRVDVVLTRGSDTGQVSETILSNVKVLAIGQRLGEMGTTGAPADPANPRAEIFSTATIATLELDPGQGETLVNAAATGSLSLALRSVADFNEPDDARRPTNQPIRLIRHGQEATLVSGAAATPTMDAAVAELSVPPITIDGSLPVSGSLPANIVPAE